MLKTIQTIQNRQKSFYEALSSSWHLISDVADRFVFEKNVEQKRSKKFFFDF